jgi:PAS domain S-box-containing protein
MLFTLSVTIAAWYGGFGAGLFATALSIVIGSYFFVEPRYSLRVPSSVEVARMILFSVVGIGISILSGQLHRAQARAAAGERHLRDVLDSLFTFVAVLTPDGTLVEVNDAPLKAAAISKQDVIGKPFWEAHWWSYSAEVRERIRKAVVQAARGETFRFDVDNLMRDGKMISVDFMLRPMLDAAGRVRNVIASAVPITERKDAEKALQRSEARLRRISDSGIVGVLHWDLDGRVLEANDAFLSMVGYSRDDLEAGRIDWKALTAPEWVQADSEGVRQLAERGAMQAFEKEYLHKDGSRVPVLITGAAFEDEPGRGVTVVLDLTGRKKAEEALRDSERRLRTLIDAAPVLVWLCGDDGSAMYLNRSWTEYTGLTEEESRGFGWLRAIHPDDAERCVAQWHESLRTRSAYEIEMRYRARDGSYRWHIARALPGPGDRPGETLWFGMSADIEDQKRNQQELQRVNEDLKQFAWAASHDLQEPLRMVVTFTQLLQRKLKPVLDEQTAEYMFFAVEGARRVEALLAGLREYWQASERGTLPDASTDLGRAAAEALRNLRIVIAESAARVRVGELPCVRAEHTPMVQLLQNLVSNAVKYRHPARPPEIHIHARPGDHEWHVCVEDNGIGIEPEYHERIFGIFKRLHGRDKYPGTGIGLALCRSIVERHGGRIWVESVPDGGSRFWFSLPGCPGAGTSG